MMVVKHEHTGSTRNLEASVAGEKRVGIMSVFLQQIALDAPDGARMGR
jgi:hypothetical protein